MKTRVLTSAAAVAIAAIAPVITASGIALGNSADKDAALVVKPNEIDLLGKALQLRTVDPDHVASFDQSLADDLKRANAEDSTKTYLDVISGSPQEIISRFSGLVSSTAQVMRRHPNVIRSKFDEIISTAPMVTADTGTQTPADTGTGSNANQGDAAKAA